MTKKVARIAAVNGATPISTRGAAQVFCLAERRSHHMKQIGFHLDVSVIVAEPLHQAREDCLCELNDEHAQYVAISAYYLIVCAAGDRHMHCKRP
jgi:hypothetical protein